MSLLDDLVAAYAVADLEQIFTQVGIDIDRVKPDRRPALKEVTLAQWLLESGRATSKLSVEALNFAGLKWRSEMKGYATPILIQVPSEAEPIEFCQFQSIEAFLIGYWKFLTRSPYVGLEDHTTTPSTFLGFLQRKGYAADVSYVSKVLKLLPEAQQLLMTASGVPMTRLPAKLQILRAPKEVEAGHSFRIEGTAALQDAGKVLLIEVDDRFNTQGSPIAEDGHWQFDFVLKQAGNRKLEISTGSETVAVTVRAVPPVDSDADEEALNPSGPVSVPLRGSVGLGGVNHAEDVKAVKQRLYELGFDWVGDLNSASVGTGMVNAIQLFQSIIMGRSSIGGDGRIDPGGPTHRWLQAMNAPQWMLMPVKGVGFINYERQQTTDNHDYGTSWLAGTIKDIGLDYETTYRSKNSGAALIALNDASIPHGGDTPDHAGHETGLMFDLLLPRKDGDFGGITYTSPEYDQNAARAMLKAINRHKLVRAVFFNDPTLIWEGLCQAVAGHHHHIHFEINPPVRA